MKKYLFILLLILFLPLELAAVELLLLQNEDMALAPGSVAVLKAKVWNPSSEPIKAKLEVELPNALIPLCSPWTEIFLGENEESLLLFPIQVNSTCEPRNYPIQLVCYSNGECIECRIANIVVGVQKNLQAAIRSKKPYIGLGEVYKVELECSNHGNAPLNLLPVISGNPFITLEEQENFGLLPGEHSTLIFHISSENEVNYCYHQVCKLQIVDADTGDTLFEESWLYEVLPRGGEAHLEKFYFPSWLTFFALRSAAENVTAGVELYGKGELEPGSGRFLEYVARAPSDMRNTILELDQQFTLHYWAPSLDVLLGDGYYCLSHLTEYGRYARGAEYAMREGAFCWGGFYAEPQVHQQCALREVAGFADCDLTTDVTAGIRYLRRVEGQLPKADLFSGELFFRAKPHVKINLECAKDFSQGHKNLGLWGSAHGELENGNFAYLESAYTEPNFYGYYNNQTFCAAGVNVNLTLNSRLLVSGNYLKQRPKNCFCDSEAWGTEPYHRQFNLQLTRNFCNGFSAMGTLLYLRGEDLSCLYNYNFQQTWIGFNLAYFRRCFNANFTSSWGIENDFKRHRHSSAIQRYDLYAEWLYSDGLSFNAHLDFGNLDYYEARHWKYTLGAGFRYCGMDHAYFQGRFDFADNIPEHNRFYHGDLRYTYQRSNGHQISAEAHLYLYSGKPFPNEEIFLLSYSIPFGTEIGTDQNAGAVQGCLWHPEGNRPLSDAIVCVNGDKRLTDECGRFAMSGLSPGYHPLTIEYLPDTLIAAQRSPEEIYVQGGAKNTLTLLAQKKSSLEGKVLLKELQMEWEEVVVDWKGWPNARLYLISEDGRTVLSTLSDETGDFYFQGIQPGAWRLKIQLEMGIYADSHYLPQEEVDLEVEPGSIASCSFYLLPKKGVMPIRR